MKEFAAGRNITLVLDNAPYHTRALEKLDHFVASRGGVAALRCYAAERICEEMGVRMRAVEILGRVSRDLCEAWCGKTLEEEDSARLKEALDASYGDKGAEEPSSSDSDLSDDVISGYSVEL
ncbi:hypothetical protein COOONC_03827 [Cooperia oncophora]